MGSRVSSSHPVVTALALRFTNAAATRSQPHTGRCPVSRPHTEKTARRVSTLGTFGRSPSRRHLSLPRYSQTYTPNTRAPLLSCSGLLQVSRNSLLSRTGEKGNRKLILVSIQQRPLLLVSGRIELSALSLSR